MVIERLTEKNIPQVVRIHKQELPGFLSELGEVFLEKFYRVLLTIPELFTFVYCENEQILGFVMGTTSAGGLYKKIFFKDTIGFVFIFLSYFITHPRGIVKLIKTLTYPGFQSDIPELLTIAVIRTRQKKGLGRKLFQQVVAEFKKRGVKKFKVSVYEKLPANGFYKKMGAKLESSFDFLGEKMNYYSYNIK